MSFCGRNSHKSLPVCRLLTLSLIALPLLAQQSASAQSVRYELSFPNAVHHEAHIRTTFRGVAKPTLEVVMSRSSPGRYALHEFAKNVSAFSAHDGAGKELEVS